MGTWNSRWRPITPAAERYEERAAFLPPRNADYVKRITNSITERHCGPGWWRLTQMVTAYFQQRYDALRVYSVGALKQRNEHRPRTLSGKRSLAHWPPFAGPVAPLAHRAQKSRLAVPIRTAERLRDSLGEQAGTQRTRKDFQKVMDAYRKSITRRQAWPRPMSPCRAVAELLEDQARFSVIPKVSKMRLASWSFCRREYPGSKFRAEALFTIGEIYRDDLDDAKQAKATFEDFVKHTPGNSRAQEARKAIAEIDNPSVAKSPFQAKAPSNAQDGKKSCAQPKRLPRPPLLTTRPTLLRSRSNRRRFCKQ